MNAETTPQTAPINEAPIVAFSRDVLNFPLYQKQAEIVSSIYSDGIRTAVLRLGRRSGKGRVAAVVATFEATVNASVHLAAVPPGERVSIVVVATSQTQARIVHRYVRKFLQAPALAPLVARDTDDEIELTNGIVITTVPATAAAARGSAVPVIIMDECSWYQGRDGSVLDAREIYDALTPSQAQFDGRRTILASTPRFSTGFFYDMCTLAASGQFPDMRTWHATTTEMNPKISPEFVAQARAQDPAAARRELDAEWDSGIGAVFESDLVRAAVREAERLPALPDVKYVVSVDPAFVGDTFAAIVGHAEPSGKIVVDVVQGWKGSRSAPVQLDLVLADLELLSAGYNRAPLLLDQFSAAVISQQMAVRGLSVSQRPWTSDLKIDAVAATRRCLYSGRLEIPPHRELVSELVTLEQKLGPSGRPHIAAPGGSHDDFAMAMLMLCLELEGPAEPGVLGVWKAMVAGWTPGLILPQSSQPLPAAKPEPPKEWTLPVAPETTRAKCPTMVRRADGTPTRCALSFGHAESHEPGEVVPV